jgi:hypothetical protein
MNTQPLSELKTEFLFEVSVDLEEAQPIGLTPHGNRQIVYVKGGTVEGPKIKGEVLPGGGDWFLIRPDGAAELDVRATLRTDDGHLIYSYYHGIIDASPEVFMRAVGGQAVDPSEYYFRTTPFYETGSEKYGWLNRIVAVGVGRIAAHWVGYSVYAVL